MSKVLIVMDGGLIQNVLVDSKDVEVYVVDYDVEGSSDYVVVPQSGGRDPVEGDVRKEEPVYNPKEVKSFSKFIDYASAVEDKVFNRGMHHGSEPCNNCIWLGSTEETDLFLCNNHPGMKGEPLILTWHGLAEHPSLYTTKAAGCQKESVPAKLAWRLSVLRGWLCE
jgi:hypothetical protein